MPALHAKIRSAKPSLLVDPATSARLARIRQKDTAAEQAVRRVLRELGLRYRVRNRDLPGAPDAANRARRWVVFVHGCFWHSHAGCYRATVPKRNRDFWLTKFADNRARDLRVLRALRRRGYRALVVWECELDDVEKLARRLRVFVSRINL
jgi:DNA mismatch endonuclease Vsr